VPEQPKRAVARSRLKSFRGYSLPQEDVEVSLLLKRGLDHLPRNRITDVEYAEEICRNQRMIEFSLVTIPPDNALGLSSARTLTGIPAGSKVGYEQKSENGFPFSAN